MTTHFYTKDFPHETRQFCANFPLICYLFAFVFQEEERQARLGPGGLDPVEVFESLPEVGLKLMLKTASTIRTNLCRIVYYFLIVFQSLQKCFESRDIALLQETISKLPEEEARLHLKRCVDSGLWVPDAAKADKEAAEAAAKAEKSAEASAPSPSSSSEPKPNISTEDVD